VAAWGSTAVNRRKKRREMGRAKRIGEIFFPERSGRGGVGSRVRMDAGGRAPVSKYFRLRGCLVWAAKFSPS
jgi:hypothetical protein